MIRIHTTVGGNSKIYYKDKPPTDFDESYLNNTICKFSDFVMGKSQKVMNITTKFQHNWFLLASFSCI